MSYPLRRRPLSGGGAHQERADAVVLALANPRNLGAIPLDRSMFQVIPAAGVLTLNSGWTVDANGYAYKSGSYTEWFRCTGLPAKATATRMYQMWWRWENVAPSNPQGVRMLFNYQNGSNFWIAAVVFNGIQWILDLAQYISAVYTSRGSMTLVSTVNYPAHFNITVFDDGDSVNALAFGYEVDVPGDDAAAFVQYSVGSRPLKSETGIQISTNDETSGNARMRGLVVVDL